MLAFCSSQVRTGDDGISPPVSPSLISSPAVVDLVHRLQAARQRGKPMPELLVEATPVEE